METDPAGTVLLQAGLLPGLLAGPTCIAGLLSIHGRIVSVRGRG